MAEDKPCTVLMELNNVVRVLLTRHFAILIRRPRQDCRSGIIKDVALCHCSEHLINPVFSASITNNAVTACSIGRGSLSFDIR
jgi:hypothetical protein